MRAGSTTVPDRPNGAGLSPEETPTQSYPEPGFLLQGESTWWHATGGPPFNTGSQDQVASIEQWLVAFLERAQKSGQGREQTARPTLQDAGTDRNETGHTAALWLAGISDRRL